MTFRELAYADTPLGELSLRRRTELKLDIDVYEIKLNDEFLMSSLFTVAEEELARLGLADINHSALDVAVGGLGLGYTAKAALEHDTINSLIVVELFEDVIKWHRQKLLPLGETLAEDQRCRMVQGDFFEMIGDNTGLDPEHPSRRFHAILLDIDHTPDFTLHDSHDAFYSADGLQRLINHLHPGGVFALWSNDPPDVKFMHVLESAFSEVQAHNVTFYNPLQNRDSSNTVYVAKTSL